MVFNQDQEEFIAALQSRYGEIPQNPNDLTAVERGQWNNLFDPHCPQQQKLQPDVSMQQEDTSTPPPASHPLCPSDYSSRVVRPLPSRLQRAGEHRPFRVSETTLSSATQQRRSLGKQPVPNSDIPDGSTLTEGNILIHNQKRWERATTPCDCCHNAGRWCWVGIKAKPSRFNLACLFCGMRKQRCERTRAMSSPSADRDSLPSEEADNERPLKHWEAGVGAGKRGPREGAEGGSNIGKELSIHANRVRVLEQAVPPKGPRESKQEGSHSVDRESPGEGRESNSRQHHIDIPRAGPITRSQRRRTLQLSSTTGQAADSDGVQIVDFGKSTLPVLSNRDVAPTPRTSRPPNFGSLGLIPCTPSGAESLGLSLIKGNSLLQKEDKDAELSAGTSTGKKCTRNPPGTFKMQTLLDFLTFQRDHYLAFRDHLLRGDGVLSGGSETEEGWVNIRNLILEQYAFIDELVAFVHPRCGSRKK